MAVELNHTIVASRDNLASARSLTHQLGLAEPAPFGPFQIVEVANGVSLDFATTTDEIRPQHYAFLVSEHDFDGILARIQDAGVPYWADPRQQRPGEINHNDGGRGVYWPSPDGHYLEILTRPYGSGD